MVPRAVLIFAIKSKELFEIGTCLQGAHHGGLVHTGNQRADDFHFATVFRNSYFALSFCLPPSFNPRGSRPHIGEGRRTDARGKWDRWLSSCSAMNTRGSIDTGGRDVEEQEMWRRRVGEGGRWQTRTNLYNLHSSKLPYPGRIRICTMEEIP